MKDILILILSIVIITYVIFKNRKTFKELSKFQIFGVGISFLVTTFLAFVLIYYGGNWFAGQISNSIFKFIIFLAVTCITLYLCVGVLNKVVRMITKGILSKE